MTTRAQAARLNRECTCAQTDVPALQQQLGRQLAQAGVAHAVTETHSHLFAESPVFVADTHLSQMRRVVEAVGAVARLPGYVSRALAGAPLLARVESAARGVLFGFDFHLEGEQARLIEINTNAGGALLNVELRRSLRLCCEAAVTGAGEDAGSLEAGILGMFLDDWRLARGDRRLATLAIVDDAPASQYLYPEFLLYRNLFAAHGIQVLIADPRELHYDGRVLSCAGRSIDLIYNRVTDFYLEEPAHAALASAYRDGAVVMTPHPHAHALFARKHNLEVLSDPDLLRGLGAAESTVSTLAAAVPRTLAVQGDEQRWWAERRQWFFKPAHGFGSRGAYRGDKLTRRVLGELMTGDYVAQRIVPPGERHRVGGGGSAPFKVDVRAYVYDARIHLLAARVYQGQTTNFRTAGGGFAPVLIVGSVRKP